MYDPVPQPYRHRASFEALGNWMAESQEFGAENMVVFVAATKCDILNRQVTAGRRGCKELVLCVNVSVNDKGWGQ